MFLYYVLKVDLLYNICYHVSIDEFCFIGVWHVYFVMYDTTDVVSHNKE